jgi:hypothetical protein
LKKWHIHVITIFKNGSLTALIAMARNNDNIIRQS